MMPRKVWNLALWVVLLASLAGAGTPPDWLVTSALGIGGMDLEVYDVAKGNMSLSLDVKRRIQERNWIGLSVASHGYLKFGASYQNSPHEFYTVVPSYSRVYLGEYTHVALTTGLGAWVLRENLNQFTCSNQSWGFGGESDDGCSEVHPLDVWRTRAGLVIPLAVQLGVHYGFVGFALQPEVGGLVPFTERPGLRGWFQVKMAGNLLF